MTDEIASVDVHMLPLFELMPQDVVGDLMSDRETLPMFVIGLLHTYLSSISISNQQPRPTATSLGCQSSLPQSLRRLTARWKRRNRPTGSVTTTQVTAGLLRDSSGSDAWSKLSRHETTLERGMYKALHEL